MKKIVALILSVILCFSVFSMCVFAEEYVEIASGQTKQVTITSVAETVLFKFVPEEDGWYEFSAAGGLDTVCTLYNGTMEQLAYSDDYNGSDFSIFCDIQQDSTYYFEVGLHSSEDNTGTFNVILKKAVLPESISLSAGNTVEIAVGEEYSVDVSIAPNDAIQKYIT